MIGVVGNVLSYARLMAIGLASVMLALIANRMGGLAESVLVGFVIAAIFHVLAFVLGFFDASGPGPAPAVRGVLQQVRGAEWRPL